MCVISSKYIVVLSLERWIFGNPVVNTVLIAMTFLVAKRLGLTSFLQEPLQ